MHEAGLPQNTSCAQAAHSKRTQSHGMRTQSNETTAHKPARAKEQGMGQRADIDRTWN